MKTLATLMIAAALFSQGSLDGEYLIIANPNTDLESVDIPELRDIYLGKRKKLNDGTKVVPVYQKTGATHKQFLSDVVKKTPAQFRTYWKRAVFTGGRVSFKRVNSEEELVHFVQENEGAIGYVSNGTELEGVKVLGVVK